MPLVQLALSAQKDAADYSRADWLRGGNAVARTSCILPGKSPARAVGDTDLQDNCRRGSAPQNELSRAPAHRPDADGGNRTIAPRTASNHDADVAHRPGQDEPENMSVAGAADGNPEGARADKMQASAPDGRISREEATPNYEKDNHHHPATHSPGRVETARCDSVCPHSAHPACVSRSNQLWGPRPSPADQISDIVGRADVLDDAAPASVPSHDTGVDASAGHEADENRQAKRCSREQQRLQPFSWDP